MITLDGKQYEVDHKKYRPSLGMPKSASLGLTGAWLIVEAAIKPKSYDITLMCTVDDVTNLRATFSKGGLLDMVDEENNHWNPAGTGTGYLNTGVFFSPGTSIPPDPVSELGWNSKNRFTVTIKLVVNDTDY